MAYILEKLCFTYTVASHTGEFSKQFNVLFSIFCMLLIFFLCRQLKANSDGTYIGFYITTNDLDLDMCSVKIYPWIPNKNNIITYQGDQKQVLDYRRNGIICGYEYYLKIDDIFNNPNEFLVNDTLTLRMNV